MRFLIIGDGHLKSDLENKAARLGLEDIVTFLGNRNDPDHFYAGLDIVALTSLNEGTPLSLIEAMACGKPVISTTAGGVVDLLGRKLDKHAGFSICQRGVLVPKNEAEDFFNGLIYLAKDEKLRIESGFWGREFVFSKYSKDNLVNNIKELYRKLAPEP
jgi:glycosyltransferase involved in cell wall biosynthesis